MSWFFYIPGLLCLFWAFVHVVLAYRTDSFKYLFSLAIVTGLFLIAESAYSDPETPLEIFLPACLAMELFGPCIVPLAAGYLKGFRRHDRESPSNLWWLFLPASLFTAGTLLYFLSDVSVLQQIKQCVESKDFGALGAYRGTVEYLFWMLSARVLRIVLEAEMLLMLVTIASTMIRNKARSRHITNFWLAGGRIGMQELQLFCIIPIFILFAIKILIERRYISTQLWVESLYVIVQSVCISILMLTALFNVKGTMTLKDIGNSMRYNYSRKRKGEAVEKMLVELLEEAEDEALKRIQERLGENLHIEQWKKGEFESEEQKEEISGNIFSALSGGWDKDSLMGRFQKLMVEEKLFLYPRLSLGDVAERLNSNKTYVSKLVNNSFNLGFPELINTMRVDYAEQYIINNRHARQNEIAEACGFLSASTFNNTFKKVTGMTPKVWIAHYDRQQEINNKTAE